MFFRLHPLLRKPLLQNAVAEAPRGAVGFEDVAGSEFVEEIYEVERKEALAVELVAEKEVLENGKPQNIH